MLFTEYLNAIRRLQPEVSFEMIEATYETACALYSLPSMDTVCIGADRHLRLAAWIIAHQPTFFRYHQMRIAPERKRAREIRARIAALQVELSGLR